MLLLVVDGSEREACMDTGPSDGLARIVRALRTTGPLTRQELMADTGFTRAQIDQRLEQLRDLGLLDESVALVNTGGRRPRALALRGSAGYVVAVHLGATQVTVGTVDLAGVILDERTMPVDLADGPEPVLQQCVELARELIDTADALPWAAGIAVPGPVDVNLGVAVSPPLMPGWDQFPIQRWLSERLDVACWLDNDANAIAVGEHRYGAGRGYPNMVFVKMGNSIGAGIIMGGLLQHGAAGCAGDLGHLPVPGATVPCRCGNIGCLDAVASGFALTRTAQELAETSRSPMLQSLRDNGPLDVLALVGAAQRGDTTAMEVLHRAGTQIGEVLASVVSLLNPSHLVLGGRLSTAGDGLLTAVRKSLYARALPLASRDLVVRRAGLGLTEGGILGISEIVYDELFGPSVLARWIGQRTPRGSRDLIAEAHQS